MRVFSLLKTIRSWRTFIPGNFATKGFWSMLPPTASGLEMFRSRKVDLMLLDLLLPEIDGVEVLKQVRTTCSPRNTSRARVHQCLSWGRRATGMGGGRQPGHPQGGRYAQSGRPNGQERAGRPPPPAVPPARTSNKAGFDPEVRKRFLSSSPKTFAALWRPLKQLASQGYHPDNQSCFHELFRVVRPLTALASVAGLDGIAQMSAALEALLKELCDAPERLSPSVVLTIAQAIDTLKFLFAYPDGGWAKKSRRGPHPGCG